MGPTRILAAVALAASLVVPSTAAAARPKTATLLTAAAGAGGSYWGVAPCGGQVKVVGQRALPAGAAADTDAWVTFDSPLGANNLAAPAAGYTNCTISFGRRRWPTATSMQQDWDLFCTTMTHELGHLLGHQHDSTPGSVMAAVFTDQFSVTEPCRAARPGLAAQAASVRGPSRGH